MVLDVAQGLRLPTDEVKSCLTRQIGESVQEGDVIARCEGAFPRLVRAPLAGQLVECHQGNVVLTTEVMTTSIKAGMPGEVEKIIPEFGAVITTWGCLVQGFGGIIRWAQAFCMCLNHRPNAHCSYLILKL